MFNISHHHDFISINSQSLAMNLQNVMIQMIIIFIVYSKFWNLILKTNWHIHLHNMWCEMIFDSTISMKNKYFIKSKWSFQWSNVLNQSYQQFQRSSHSKPRLGMKMIKINCRIIETIRSQTPKPNQRSTSEIEKKKDWSCPHETVFRSWMDLVEKRRKIASNIIEL